MKILFKTVLLRIKYFKKFFSSKFYSYMFVFSACFLINVIFIFFPFISSHTTEEKIIDLWTKKFSEWIYSNSEYKIKNLSKYFIITYARDRNIRYICTYIVYNIIISEQKELLICYFSKLKIFSLNFRKLYHNDSKSWLLDIIHN